MGTFLSTIASTRPDRLTDTKDESYHLRWGKWAMMVGYNNPMQADYVERIRRNEDFYRNIQWKSQEDIDTFLKDQSGQDRNRIMFTMNMIRKLVELYRGNSLRMDLNFEAHNESPYSVRRRDQRLAEMLFFTDQAIRNPYFSEGLKSRLFIGENAKETEKLFVNGYRDELTKEVNDLLKAVAGYNQFDDLIKLQVAETLAFSGLGLVHDMEYAGRQVFQHLQTKDFFWDRNARRPDLQDSEYMGFVEYLSAPQILESAVEPLDEQAKHNIENYDKRATNPYYNQWDYRSGQPVITAYWRDTQPEWYGYVLDEFKTPMFTRINYTEPGAEQPKYTDADLVDPPKNQSTQRRMRGKKKIRIDIDQIRFCRFVPYQASSTGINQHKKNGQVDVVLDYGLLPYQDNRYEDYRNVRYPIKAWTWSYLNGEVSSPVDDAINPQRFLNRVISAAENQINNSGGSGVALDNDFTDMDEAELTSAINQSKPIIGSSKGRGVNNMVGRYDGGVQQSTYKLFDLLPVMKDIVQGSTGTNEAMMGESIGQDQLVGVTNALLQEGSVIQAPFYHAVLMIFKQMYESIANRGKRIYIDNPYELISAVGDHGANVIKMSGSAKIEDFRIVIRLEQSARVQRQAVDQTLFVLRAQGMIDGTRAANIFGRGNMDDVNRAVREFAADQSIMAKAQVQQQAAQQEQVIQLYQQEKADQQKALTDERAFELLRDNNKSKNKKEEKMAALAGKALFTPPPPVAK